MYINDIILRLMLPIFFITVDYAKAQGFVNFPTGTPIIPSPTPTVINNEIDVVLNMQGATTTRANQTVCTGFNLAPTDLFFIFQFAGHADYSKVHHMGLYGCSITPANNACRCPMINRSQLFTWARNTPAIRFTGTKSFGVFRVGQGTDRNFIFLETHYFNKLTTPDTTSGITIRITRNLNKNPPKGSYYELAVYSLMGTGTIPAQLTSYSIDTCFSKTNWPSSWTGSPSVIGFQSHTHNLGRVVSTFLGNGSSLSSSNTYELGVGNPLWPNAYVAPVSGPTRRPINSSFNLYNRCVYSSAGVANDTNTNGKFATPTAWHEMCVQSLILGRDSTNGPWNSTTPAFLTGKCTQVQSNNLNVIMPSRFPATMTSTNSALNAYATSGTGTGSYSYTSANKINYNINLDLQTFGAYFN